MESPRLKINEHEIGLRKLDDNLFEPKNINILRSVVNDNSPDFTSNSFYELNPIDPDTEKEYHKIQSFCFVATREVMKEAAVLLYSLRLFHQEPVYIICDIPTQHYLQTKGYSNLHFKRAATPDALDKVNSRHFQTRYQHLNNFHRTDCIFKKMECMRFALMHHDNTLFLDSDIIVLDNLQEKFTSDIVLSPHHYAKDKIYNGFEFGFYNAGYLFCACKRFPAYWEHIYLHDSVFFEQECMNRIPDQYKIQTFDTKHNVGFWRTEPDLNIKYKSLHGHIFVTDSIENKTLRQQNMVMREFIIEYTKRHCTKVYDYINNISNIKNKVAFIHFGKCAGVYINTKFKSEIMNRCTFINSWWDCNPRGKNLRRDWTEDELLQIANNDLFEDIKPNYQFVHNHHNNWDENTIQAFKDKGWFTFMFLRDPRDIICSLYFFGKKLLIKRGKTPIGNGGVLAGQSIKPLKHSLDITNLELDEFFIKMITSDEQYRFWKLPDYIDQLDYVNIFSDDNFALFTLEHFGYSCTPTKRLNVSDNKGYAHYCKTGKISTYAQDLINGHPEYIRYQQYLNK